MLFPGLCAPSTTRGGSEASPHRYRKYYKSHINEALEFLYEEKFELRNDVKPETTINWIFRNNGIFDGYSDSPASRSLNFFTRLFVTDYRNDELSDFVWAVAGIEALLVEGGRSSVGQLKDKLTAIFQSRGSSKWLHKWISDVYNFRSRMIHGDRQIRSAFRADEDDVKSRFYEEYHSLLFAVGILFALLQETIALDTRKFEFTTIVGKTT
ncbi:hypothetical protein IVA83_30430 [Bradyrhizobium sp. 143]|nr:hypothetical protein [Bradyrhizobium sp. 143]MCK1727403.1 hypothetical protein [Bradyrhizobium sp. 142]